MEILCLIIGLFIGYLMGVLTMSGGKRDGDDAVGIFFHNALLTLRENEAVHYSISRSNGDDDGGEPEPEYLPFDLSKRSNN